MPEIRKIFDTSAFKKAILLAGENGLDKEFTTITVAEVPDAADWLHGGEIVCTTGFFVRDNSVSQVQWIESLIERGAAALAIKTARFLGDISKGVRLLAEARKFPIIGLPAQSTWPYVIESVMNLVNDNQLSMLKQTEEIHRQLTDLVLKGSSINEIGQALANLINNPVIVEDGRVELIAANVPSSHDITPDRRSVMEEAIDARTSKQYQTAILHSDYYQQVITGRSKEILRRKLSHPKNFDSVTLPIITSGIVYGFLTLLEISNKHSSLDLAALEHGATAISLNLVRQTIQTNDRRLQEKEVVKDLIQGRLRTSELRNIGLSTIDWSRPMVVILIDSEFNPTSDRVYTAERPENQLEETVRKLIGNEFGNCIIGYDDGIHTLLIPIPTTERERLSFALEDVLGNIRRRTEEELPLRQLNIAVGGFYPSRESLYQSYQDAQRTLEIAKQMPSLGAVVFHHNIGLYQFIHTIKDHHFLQTYRDNYLEPLIEHDSTNSDLLCDTLFTYLKYSGNIKLTAKSLFVHPNTITYRIKKIAGILDRSLDDPDYRMSLLLALGVREYLDNTTNQPV